MTPTIHWFGAAAAIGAAFFWAVAAFLFRRVGAQVAPLTMNFVKGLVALACLTFLLGGDVLTMPPWATVIALALSGIIGIGLGDTLYFYALHRLGARRTLVTTTLVPVAAAVGGSLVFGDALTWLHVCAMALVLGGVTFVLWERTPGEVVDVRAAGVLFGVIYVAAEASGILLTKYAVVDWSALHASLIRQFCATIVIGILVSSQRQAVLPRLSSTMWRWLLLASVAGAFLGTWLSVEALKYAHTAVATTLSSTSPLFAIPLAMMWERERVSVRAIGATIVATFGVAILFVYG